MTSHLIWIEAHYALGKLEVEQGFTLDWRARRDFLTEYIASKEALAVQNTGNKSQ